MTYLTDKDRETLAAACEGWGEYGCCHEQTHERRNGRRRALPSPIPAPMFAAVEAIIDARLAEAWGEGYDLGWGSANEDDHPQAALERVEALAAEWATHVLPPEAGHLVDALRAALALAPATTPDQP